MQFQGEPFQRGIEYPESGENSRFSTEIAVYLGNGTRQACPVDMER